ncbi:hypothetical protein [uncultured Polaribacter sp.]|uniref:hypothetical protein n=1 Tax=uncultured Polaribacter sp. TaxID=174711 RepID=UPI00261A9700|nr:hypothetical protein [uncultured Polaribacter sp.]
MKFLSIIAILISFTQCGSIKLENNPPFTIEKASYHHWIGGQPGISGSNIEIELKENSNIDFDSIFFQNNSTKLEINTVDNKTILIGNFNTSKRSKRNLILDSNAVNELKNEIPKSQNIPFKLLENEAIITYKTKNKLKYFKIKNIQKAKRKFFPRTNKA